ncbi:MAG: alpha/beta hydrolase [Roseovarius sp.]
MWRLCFLAAMICLPLPALSEPVQIEGPSGPLEAELLRSEGARHVLVIVPGSGPVDRDGNGPQLGLSSDSYRLLAEALQAEGIPSMRIDKRGFFGSAAAVSDPEDVTIAAYARDARDWVGRAAEEAPCVWLAGHSEGGLVALMAAQAPPDSLCGLILMAAPGRPVGQLMLEQFAANPANAAVMPDLEALVDELEAGRTVAPDKLDPTLRPMFTEGLQRYMTDLFAHDPIELAQAWTGPVLVLQGDADLQVKVEDARRLAEAMPQAETTTLEGATHMLKADVPGQPFASYQNPDLPLHGQLVSDIVTFVTENSE